MTEIRVVDLCGSERYQAWMEENAGRVQVLGVRSTDRRWPILYGALGSVRTGERDYSVTYRECPTSSPS